MPLRFAAYLSALLALVPAAGTGNAAPPSTGSWEAVLAAGDVAEPVFDNAVAALTAWLTGRGVPPRDIHRLSASPAPRDRGAEPASAGRLLQRVARLPERPGARCLVFITSHGNHDGTVWLAYDGEALRPAALAQALASGCGAAPTVVIVSSCYSGAFDSGSMQAPNRIILTAARADRPSFGCQADRTYTVFDECLLGALPRAQLWRQVFDATRACVRRQEQQLGFQASLPQAYFGVAVRDLPLP